LLQPDMRRPGCAHCLRAVPALPAPRRMPVLLGPEPHADGLVPFGVGDPRSLQMPPRKKTIYWVWPTPDRTCVQGARHRGPGYLSDQIRHILQCSVAAPDGSNIYVHISPWSQAL